ncbi:MAG: rod shape-determining protein [Chryseotalea sp.]|jgi:rod shape-determining protein MreB
MLLRDKSFAIDLGNNNTLITDKSGIKANQPSYIVLDDSQRVKAVGESAYACWGKEHEALHPIKPLRGGVIADYKAADKMIKTLVEEVFGRSLFSKGFDQVISGVPYHTTHVEREAFRNSLEQFRARHTGLLFEPLAAALGLNLNIEEPKGKMIVDIGGGITEIVVISLSGVAAFESIRTAGDAFDMAIQDYMRKNYQLLIGQKTAEDVKKKIGGVYLDIKQKPNAVSIKGKSLEDGIPTAIVISYEEMVNILQPTFSEIESAIFKTLQNCPPELAADIYQSGIYLTGGSSLLLGVKEKIEKLTGLKVMQDPNALTSVSLGITKVMQQPSKFKNVLVLQH